MNEDDLIKQLEYINPYELFVVSWNNKLIVLRCPFKVRVVHDIGELIKDDLVIVTKVMVTPDLITVFIVKNKAFYYCHFEIIVDN